VPVNVHSGTGNPDFTQRLASGELGLVVGLYLTARLLMPGPVSPGLPANPLGAESVAGFLELLQAIAGVTTPFLALAVVGSLVLRFRRSRGDERQQLKWITYAGGLLPLAVLAYLLPEVVGTVVFAVPLVFLPVAVGIVLAKLIDWRGHAHPRR
jgi:hypothetical protein